MSIEAKDFDFTTGDLEAFLKDVRGINILFRNRMRGVLKSEENEMPRLREIFDDIVRREEENNVKLMTPAFRAGFVTLFNMNAATKDQIR